MPQTTASGFDMSFLDSGQTAGVFSDIASATDTWNTQLGAHIDELAQLSDSETISAAINQLGRAREGLSAGGYALAASSAALAAQKSADDQWRRAPQDDELEEARRAVTEASKELAAADSQAAIAAEAKLKAAIEHSRDLNERRRQADKDFVDASGKIQGRLREFNPDEGKNKKQKDKKDNENGRAVPGKKPELKANASPAPSNHRAPAVPGAPVAAPPSPGASSGSTSSGSPASDAALTALLQRTGQLPPAQPAQQQPQQQPQTAPAAAAGPSSAPSPVSNPKSKVEGAINADDIPGIAAAPVPLAMGPAAGPAPAAAASPAPAPATSGNSAADLSTDSNVSGRPDAPRGAFNQPHTSASGATGTATGAGTGTSSLNQKGMQAAGMPATGMPMAGMPMAPGTAGSRGGTVKPVQAHQYSNVYEEGVVRGGTIAQNRPDFTEKG